MASKVPDTDTYAHKLHLSDFLRDPVIRSAIQALQLPSGSLGLDVGCGIGSHTLLLAKAVGPSGHIIGLDFSPDLLAHAKDNARKCGLSERVSFQQGDVSKLPFEDETFDWVWSVDCVGFITGEPLLLVKELARVVKPSGSVAILVWSSQQLLPGYPLLEARLNATSSGIAPFTKGMRPELHFLRALSWFRKLGLKEPRAKVFAESFYAPLSREIRNALVSLFDMRWPNVAPELSSDDLAEFQRLCLPDSPDFILNLPDYYALFTYTMFWGKTAN